MDAMTAPLNVRRFAQARHTVTAPHQGLYEITGDILAWSRSTDRDGGAVDLSLLKTGIP